MNSKQHINQGRAVTPKYLHCVQLQNLLRKLKPRSLFYSQTWKRSEKDNYVECFDATRYGFKHVVCSEKLIHKYQCYTGQNWNIQVNQWHGAASSAYILIIFVNGLFRYLRAICRMNSILGIIHNLIHADDTIILATSSNVLSLKLHPP